LSASRTKPISGFKTTPRFRKLRPALKNWIAIIDEFVRQRGEAPYIYSNYERVNCGLLAAGFWRAHIPTLHETAVMRKDQEQFGRADLDFWLGRKEYFIEAKMSWLSLSTFPVADTTAKTLCERLARVTRDSRKYIVDPDDRWLATAFVIPAVPEEAWKREDERMWLLDQFVRALHLFDADIKAWCLPKGYQRWRGCEDEAGDRFYPAVAMLGRLVPKGKPRA
jgi:hypothetical protein